MRPTALRPYGVILNGRLEVGLELVMDGEGGVEVRPHTGLPEPFIVSPAFVNAHSHLEYRGFQGTISGLPYGAWIQELTRRKREQTPDEVRRDCFVAAEENRATGVWFIGEHSDRLGAAEAMQALGLKGHVYQEVITLIERENPAPKLQEIEAKAIENRRLFDGEVTLSPHAYQTVDIRTLESFAGKPISIHVAETDMENELTRDGAGPGAEFRRAFGHPVEATGLSIVETLAHLGLVGKNVQFVHCCAVSASDIEILVRHGVNVAHCPRSNRALGCPTAPIREMLDAGLTVGLGLDSAASSGPIDMFAEMRAALVASAERGRPLEPEEVWQMATAGRSLTEAPLIKIHISDAYATEDAIIRGNSQRISWVIPSG